MIEIDIDELEEITAMRWQSKPRASKDGDACK
jgi:hypothetical protein